uniref:VOC domain-containing protein n=1 Tax=Attheya septentrionalis TaxID=420275 RepID=A0A7S2UAJ4_9STRA|mmetsp:Transcript_17435/g.31462  ORF Transcript_17435/g.31462 Transcript_17435/m.31462 type:complete len:199 (+) Transcript_17435:136-732(+)
MIAIRFAVAGFRKIAQQTSPAVSGSIQSQMRTQGVGGIPTSRMVHGSGFTHQYGFSRLKSISLRYQRMPQRLMSAASPDEKPFEILGLQQIAIGSLTKEPMTSLWQDIFGLTKVGSFVSEKENVDEDILTLGPNKTNASPLACIEVDLMSPLDPEKSPKVHSPALNHIGLWVDDLEAAVSWMTKHGEEFDLFHCELNS